MGKFYVFIGIQLLLIYFQKLNILNDRARRAVSGTLSFKFGTIEGANCFPENSNLSPTTLTFATLRLFSYKLLNCSKKSKTYL
jgi:hypothetical protein